MKLFTAIAIPYLFVCAMLYLIGYWGALGIDPFAYLGLSDLVASAAMPLLYGLLSAVVGIVIGASTHRVVEPAASATAIAFVKQRQTGAGPLLTIARHWQLLFIGLPVIAAIAASLLIPEPWRWTIVAVFVMVCGMGLTQMQSVKEYVPEVICNAIPTLLLILVLSFSVGRTNAYRANLDGGRIEVDLQRSDIWVASLSPPIVFLGRLGEHVFLLERPTGSVIAIKEPSTLVLNTRSK